MQVSGTSSSNYQKPDPGTVSAVCTRIIDLGTQETNYKGDVKKKRQVLLAWEIDQKMTDGRPFLATSRFTASIHEKATLGKFLENWRGRAFTDEERKGFDLKTILGQPCLLTLVQNGEYVNVASAVKLPKNMPSLAPESPLVLLDLSNFDLNAYSALSDHLKGIIAKSPEYDLAVGGQGHTGTGTPPEDIPF